MEDMKRLWEVFANEADNTVSIVELRTIMRALDLDPSEDELIAVNNQIDPEEKGFFDFPGLVLVMEDKLKDVDTPEDLLEEFKKLDRDQDGRIPNPEFK